MFYENWSNGEEVKTHLFSKAIVRESSWISLTKPCRRDRNTDQRLNIVPALKEEFFMSSRKSDILGMGTHFFYFVHAHKVYTHC